MRWRGWERLPLEIGDPGLPDGGTQTVDAIAPLIVSASRSTDIPAFYGDWFISRLRSGYVTWKSPFWGKPVYVSFQKTRLFVFWSKNPEPFIQNLNTIESGGYGYYFLYTLNDYDRDGLEPNLPPVADRIETFIRLSERIGKGKLLWRFDPLILSDAITVRSLLERIELIGDRISPYCERMIFSFVNIEKYAKVRRNLRTRGFPSVREFTDAEVREFCAGLADLNRRWGLSLFACGEPRDLSAFGVLPGQCISFDLIRKEFGKDPILMDLLQPGRAGQQTLTGPLPSASPSRWLKDPGQKNACNCIVAKDIGQYSTCMHLCVYCYANTSPLRVTINHQRHGENAGRGIFSDSIIR
ncbi:MAG: hypothetical protein METHP_01339 [Methanoregula sp. SKADARSKE-2]|nr:MAG: hypothetical protein METHP_01339 [Methanoregula sp. SKADARSKE-2]